MKALSKPVLLALTLALILFGCQPDNVKPADQANNGASSLNAADTDPHPLPDPVCSRFDTIRLATPANPGPGFKVDYCGQWATCPPNMPDWGFVEILSGEDILVMNFTLAVGWFADLNRSSIGLANGFTFDQNTGVPDSQNDWQSIDIDPVVNKWQLRYDLSTLPSPCFNVALNLTVVRLNFFTGVDPNSTTNLWGYNTDWNNTSTPEMNSISPFLTPWCPPFCGPDPTDCTREFATYSQCQYGICGAEGPMGAYRDNNFASVFPSGLTIGCPNGYVATFNSAQAIENFLPSQGGQDPLTANHNNPIGRVAVNSTFNFCADWNTGLACGTIDFQKSGVKELNNGTPLAAGTFITNQFRSDIGMVISGACNNINGTGDVIIFDSNNPSGGDFDLGTPNQAFSGPGVGTGGAMGAGVNNVSQGNLIILAENVADLDSDGLVDTPKGDAMGGTITFDFDTPITIQAVSLVDLDDNEVTTVKVFFADSRPPLTFNAPQIGENAKKLIMTKELDNSWADHVVKVEVTSSGKCGVAFICFCHENPYENSACINTTGNGLRSTLAGRLVTAILNVRFDAEDPNFGPAYFPFGYMVVRSGPFGGMRVTEVISEANTFLGGCPSTFSKADLTYALEQINFSFLNGTRQSNYLICPEIPQ